MCLTTPKSGPYASALVREYFPRSLVTKGQLSFAQSWLYLQRTNAQIERKYGRAFIRVYADLARATATAYRTRKNPDNLYHVIVTHLRLHLEPLLVRLFRDASTEVGPLVALFTQYNSKAATQEPWSITGFANRFRAKASEIVSSVALSLQLQLKRMITAAIIAKLTVEQIVLKIQQFFGFSSARALQMVRTQIHSAGMAGQYEIAALSYRQNGLLKTWKATEDDRVRPTHETAGVTQKRIPFDQPFMVGGYECQYPGDPALPYEELVNCRCSMTLIVPVL
jgi:hypothetical protein